MRRKAILLNRIYWRLRKDERRIELSRRVYGLHLLLSATSGRPLRLSETRNRHVGAGKKRRTWARFERILCSRRQWRWNILAASSAGTRMVLVKTGKGENTLTGDKKEWIKGEPDHIGENLLGAVKWIRKDKKGSEFMNIRNSAKAVIIKDSKMLLTKNRDKDGLYYIFPGGGQDHGESLTETVVRECMEEIGAEIEAEQLLHIREYIGKNHEHSGFDSGIHQIEYYFLSKLKHDESEFLEPSNPDTNQIGIEWIAISELQSFRIYPKAIIQQLQDFTENKFGAVYLGDVN